MNNSTDISGLDILVSLLWPVAYLIIIILMIWAISIVVILGIEYIYKKCARQNFTDPSS